MAGIELQHRRFADPGVGFELVAHDGGVEEQQRRAAVDAADRKHLILAQLLAAIDGDARNPESGGVCDRVAGVAQSCSEFLEVTALDDAEPGAAEQNQDGRDDAGAVRKVTLEKRNQPVRPFAFQKRFGG